MPDPCMSCPHNIHQRVAQLHSEIHPNLPELDFSQTVDGSRCSEIVKAALYGRATQICSHNASCNMGRPFQGDLHEADRELAPVLKVVVDQFVESYKPKVETEADPYAPTAKLIPVPETSKPQLAKVFLKSGAPEQKKEALAWIQGKLDAKAFFCEKLHQCKWQGFRLHQGLGWGAIPGERDPWRVWHEKECGGKLVELFLKPDQEARSTK